MQPILMFALLCWASTSHARTSAKSETHIDAGIEVHAQVVLCPKINDGDVLLKTIEDLSAEYPRITSVAIVPLGLTRYNTDPRLTAVTPEFCSSVIDQLKPVQKKLQERLGTNFALLGDEIYIKAGRSIP